MMMPLLMLVFSTTHVWGATPSAASKMVYCKDDPSKWTATSDMQTFWATTPLGKKNTPILKAFQPNPAKFRPLGIGEQCSQASVDKNEGVDPGCLVNRNCFLCLAIASVNHNY